MKFTRIYNLKEIANLINARFIGDPDFPVTGINEIHMVEQGDLTFVDHPKYYNKALNSKATTILINKEVIPPQGKSLIISDNPFDDYVFLVKNFRPFEKAVAVISPSAKIGSGTIIQPGAFIGNHVVIGTDCIIHSNVSIYDHSVIGNHVILHSNCVIGADAYYYQKRPAGYKKLESCGRVVIEDDVEIGALTSIDKGVSGDTIISRGTKFDNHVQVGHDTYIGKNCLIGAYCAIAGVTRIEDEVILWAGVLVNKDLVIGKGAVLLAGCGTERSLEGGKIYWGIPAVEARKKWKELATLRQIVEDHQKKQTRTNP
jgi:UDP-3-O-[3-hydroxymyristoyl] glucosamine N-acyltransferase